MSHLDPSPEIIGINHLPDELLSVIFEDPEVPIDVLFQLCLVSRRLHYFTIPIYLQRFKIKRPQDTAIIVFRDLPIGTLDALDGLRVALYIHEIKNLTIRFDFNNTPNDVHIVMRHMHRVYDLLCKLNSVYNVVLKFTEHGCGCCPAPTDGTNLDDLLAEWSRTAGQTLDKILEKGCVTLRILGGRYLSHTYNFRTQPPEKKLAKRPSTGGIRLSGLKKIFRSKSSDARQEVVQVRVIPPPQPEILRHVLASDTSGWSFERNESTGASMVVTTLGLTAKFRSRLRSLDIQSMMMLGLPLLHWTACAIKLPSMQTLKLSRLSINQKCWPAIFSIISQVNTELRDIQFERIRQVMPADLIRFIGHFQSLSTLVITRDVESYIDLEDRYQTFPDFPRLITLKAPAGFMSKLLASQRKGLGRLESLTIAYKLRNEGLVNWLRRCPDPCIPSYLREKPRPLTISLEVYVEHNPGWQMWQDLRMSAALRRPEAGDISSLTLIFDKPLMVNDKPLITVFAQWITLFLELRHLSIETKRNTISQELRDSLIASAKESGSLKTIKCEVDGVEIELDNEPPSPHEEPIEGSGLP